MGREYLVVPHPLLPGIWHHKVWVQADASAYELVPAEVAEVLFVGVFGTFEALYRVYLFNWEFREPPLFLTPDEADLPPERRPPLVRGLFRELDRVRASQVTRACAPGTSLPPSVGDLA